MEYSTLNIHLCSLFLFLWHHLPCLIDMWDVLFPIESCLLTQKVAQRTSMLSLLCGDRFLNKVKFGGKK